MNKTERAAGPTIGAALAYFTVKFATPQLEWLTVEDQIEAVAMLSIIYMHIIIELRTFSAYLKGRFSR